jgi:hypothetical protein
LIGLNKILIFPKIQKYQEYQKKKKKNIKKKYQKKKKIPKKNSNKCLLAIKIIKKYLNFEFHKKNWISKLPKRLTFIY